jgi:hypothetical protein
VVVADNSILAGTASIELKLKSLPVLFGSSAKPIRTEVRLSNKSAAANPNNRSCVVLATIRNVQSVDLENVANRYISVAHRSIALVARPARCQSLSVFLTQCLHLQPLSHQKLPPKSISSLSGLSRSSTSRSQSGLSDRKCWTTHHSRHQSGTAVSSAGAVDSYQSIRTSLASRDWSWSAVSCCKLMPFHDVLQVALSRTTSKQEIAL